MFKRKNSDSSIGIKFDMCPEHKNNNCPKYKYAWHNIFFISTFEHIIQLHHEVQRLPNFR